MPKIKYFLTHEGRTQSLSAWSAEMGVFRETIYTRKRRGWTDAECLLGRPREPVRNYGPRKNTVLFPYRGKQLSLMQIAKLTGMHYRTLYMRYRRGCTDIDTILRM